MSVSQEMPRALGDNGSKHGKKKSKAMHTVVQTAIQDTQLRVLPKDTHQIKPTPTTHKHTQKEREA